MFKKVLNQDSVGGPNEWSSKIQLGQIGQGRMTCWFCPRGRVSEPQTSNCSTCTRRSRVLKCARLQHSTLPLLHALHRSYPEYKWGQKSSHISYFPCIPIPKLNNKQLKMIIKNHFKPSQKVVQLSKIVSLIISSFCKWKGCLLVKVQGKSDLMLPEENLTCSQKKKKQVFEYSLSSATFSHRRRVSAATFSTPPPPCCIFLSHSHPRSFCCCIFLFHSHPRSFCTSPPSFSSPRSVRDSLFYKPQSFASPAKVFVKYISLGKKNLV